MNRLSRSRQVDVLNLLLEGCSIRSTARLTGVHKTTIGSLLVAAGAQCQALLDHELHHLACPIIEADEIWTFVRKKQRRLTAVEQHNPAIGDQYAFVGFDPRSKLVAAHVIGKRDAETTTLFLEQLRSRVPGRIQFFTDGFHEYESAVDGIYGTAIDYAQVIKPVPPATPGAPGSLHIVQRVGHPDPALHRDVVRRAEQSDDAPTHPTVYQEEFRVLENAEASTGGRRAVLRALQFLPRAWIASGDARHGRGNY